MIFVLEEAYICSLVLYIKPTSISEHELHNYMNNNRLIGLSQGLVGVNWSEFNFSSDSVQE